jgi:hypothetical protein
VAGHANVVFGGARVVCNSFMQMMTGVIGDNDLAPSFQGWA